MTRDSAVRGADGNSLRLLLTASVGCAMTLVDTNVVAVAVPAIARQLGASAADSQWIISAFFLSFAASLLPAGAIADRHGRRRIFLGGLASLAVASFMSGTAPTTAWLLFGRGLQGVATAFVLAPALAIIGHRFHGEAERNRAWAIWGGVMGATMVVAPIIGGLIVQSLGWRWAFFINVPICITLGVATIAYADESRDDSRGKLDPAGIILFAASMFGLIWGLINGQAHGWTSPVALAGFSLGALALVAFVLVERVHSSPMLDLKLFRSPQFIGAVWAMFAYAAAAQVMASLLPIFLQNGGGLSAVGSGIAMLPFALAMLAFPYLGAMLGRRLPSSSILVLGLCIVALGNAAAGLGAYSGNWAMLLSGMFVTGSGAGLLNGETQKAIMLAIPRAKAGIASGISTTARFSGITIGFAVLNAVLAIAGAPAHDAGVALAQVRELYSAAFSASLMTAAAIAAASAVLVWALMRSRKTAARQVA